MSEQPNTLDTIQQDLLHEIQDRLRNEIVKRPYGVCGYPCGGDCMSCDLYIRITAKKLLAELNHHVQQDSNQK
jgi:hypothetical protein